MNVFFPLKNAHPIDILGTFSNHIKKNYGGEAAFAPVKATFEKIQSRRQALDYKELNKLISNDYRICDELQGKLIDYLNDALLLDKRFKFENFHPKYVELPVTWFDSFQENNQIRMSNFKLEIACTLYNFAVNEFHSGLNYSLNPVEEDKKKAISIFRVGVWAVREIKQLQPLFQKDSKASFCDFSLTNLNVLENLMLGLAYLAIYENNLKNEKSLGITTMASIISEAANHFKFAQSIFVQDKALQMPQNIHIRLRILLFYYSSYCEGLACSKMYKHHDSLREDKPLEGHFGLMYSYINKGFSIMNAATQREKEFDFLPSVMKERLSLLAKEFRQLLPDLKLKNDYIYKQRTFTPDELPSPQELAQKFKLGGCAPSLFQQPHPEEKFFENFISEEIKRELKEYRDFAESKRYELELSMSALINGRDKVYLENYVNAYLDMDTGAISKERRLPSTFKGKLDNFKSKSVPNGYQEGMNTLMKLSLNIGTSLQDLKKILEDEKKEDMELRAHFKHLWNRSPSEILNHEYYQALQEVIDKYKQAQNIDSEISKKYKENNKYLELFKKSEDEILNSLPQDDKDGGSSDDGALIASIREKNGNVEKIVILMMELLQKANNFINNNEYAKAYMEISTQVFNKAQITDKIMLPLIQIIANFNENLKKAENFIKEICLSAQELNSRRAGGGAGGGGSATLKALEQLSNSLGQLSKLNEDLENGISFYQKMLNYLAQLKKNIEDFVCAREFEKTNLIEFITNGMGVQVQPNPQPKVQSQQVPVQQAQKAQPEVKEIQKQQPVAKPSDNLVSQAQANLKPAQGQKISPSIFQEEDPNPILRAPPESWFNPENNSFPMGQSVFIPQKKQAAAAGNGAGGIFNPANIFESTVVDSPSEAQNKKK